MFDCSHSKNLMFIFAKLDLSILILLVSKFLCMEVFTGLLFLLGPVAVYYNRSKKQSNLVKSCFKILQCCFLV